MNMKTVACLLLTCSWLSALAQTNSAPGEPATSSPPTAESQVKPADELEQPAPTLATNDRVRLQLDLPPPKPEHPLLDDFTTLNFEDAHSPIEANSEQALMLRYAERLENAGYMKPSPLPPDDLFSRTVNAMFQPEPVRVGRTTVAFSPITAIKRKNPLALLNPIVLNISW